MLGREPETTAQVQMDAVLASGCVGDGVMNIVNLRAVGAPYGAEEEPVKTTLKCDRCTAPVDPTTDPECEVYVGNYKRLHATEYLCEACRYQLECDREHFEALVSRAEYEAERMADR